MMGQPLTACAAPWEAKMAWSSAQATFFVFESLAWFGKGVLQTCSLRGAPLALAGRDGLTSGDGTMA